MSDLLVLHPLGDPAGGAPWREAFSDAGWEGRVHAPDLPGHAGAPPPPGGAYQSADPALTGTLLLAGLPAGSPAPVVVGVGPSGWAAQLLALGGRAGALALVDGLGGPWREPSAAVAADREWLRALSSDPPALVPPPPGAPLDPRLRHGVPPQTDRTLALRSAAAMPVPVLVLTTIPVTPPPATSAPALSAAEVDELVAAFPRAEVAHLEGPSSALVARTIVAWAGR